MRKAAPRRDCARQPRPRCPRCSSAAKSSRPMNPDAPMSRMRMLADGSRRACGRRRRARGALVAVVAPQVLRRGTRARALRPRGSRPSAASRRSAGSGASSARKCDDEALRRAAGARRSRRRSRRPEACCSRPTSVIVYAGRPKNSTHSPSPRPGTWSGSTIVPPPPRMCLSTLRTPARFAVAMWRAVRARAPICAPRASARSSHGELVGPVHRHQEPGSCGPEVAAGDRRSRRGGASRR